MTARNRPLIACWLSIALSLVAVASAGNVRTSRTILDRLIQIRQLEQPDFGESDRDRDTRILHAYESYFRAAQKHVQELSNTDVELLIRAATGASFYTDSKKPVRDAETDLSELRARGDVRDRDVLDVYRELVKHRMLLEAKRMFNEHHVNGMERLPRVIDREKSISRARTEYLIESNAYEVVRETATVPKTGILVIATPGCHFAVLAARAIHGNPVLQPIFRAHSKWLAPADEYFDIHAFQEWNSKHPDAVMTVAYRNSDWAVSDDVLPSFYFLRDGQLLKTIRGWPPEGGRKAFEDALKLVGVLPSGVTVRWDQHSETTPRAAVGVTFPSGQSGDTQSFAGQFNIDIGTATIKSKADLEAYLTRTQMSGSPLRFLSPIDRKLFLSGLVFNENGLAGFRFTDLDGLTATHAYELLSLFGWQRVVPQIEGIRVEDSLDRMIMRGGALHN